MIIINELFRALILVSPVLRIVKLMKSVITPCVDHILFLVNGLLVNRPWSLGSVVSCWAISWWSSCLRGASSLVIFLSVCSDWSSLLLMNYLDVWLAFATTPLSLIVILFLFHEFLSASVELLFTLIFCFLDFHSRFNINGFHFLLICSIKVLVNATKLLIINSHFWWRLVSLLISLWIRPWCLSKMSGLLCSHIVSLTWISVLLIVTLLSLVVDFFVTILLSIHLLLMILQFLLLFSHLSLMSEVLFSVHYLMFGTGVESFDLHLVFSLLSLKLGSINNRGSRRNVLLLFLMIVNVVVDLTALMALLVYWTLALRVLLHGSLTLWLSSSSWSCIRQLILWRSINDVQFIKLLFHELVGVLNTPFNNFLSPASSWRLTLKLLIGVIEVWLIDILLETSLACGFDSRVESIIIMDNVILVEVWRDRIFVHNIYLIDVRSNFFVLGLHNPGWTSTSMSPALSRVLEMFLGGRLSLVIFLLVVMHIFLFKI